MKKHGQTMDDFRQMVSKILGNSADEPKKDADRKPAVENVGIKSGAGWISLDYTKKL